MEEVINEKVEINKRHSELYQKGLDLVDDFLTQYAIEIEKWKSGKVEKPKASPYALECLMNCIQKGQNGQRLAYNIDGNDTAETDPEIFTIEGIDTEKI